MVGRSEDNIIYQPKIASTAGGEGPLRNAVSSLRNFPHLLLNSEVFNQKCNLKTVDTLSTQTFTLKAET